MSVATGDMQGWCYYQWDVCDRPDTIAIDESAYFKPKPDNLIAAPQPSGE
jgi:sphingomyelin phosphodiesterase